MACPLYKMKGPGLVPDSGRAHPPAFPLKHQQKDIRLALALGDDVAQPLPVAAAANEVFKKARTMGAGGTIAPSAHCVRTAVLEILLLQERQPRCIVCRLVTCSPGPFKGPWRFVSCSIRSTQCFASADRPSSLGPQASATMTSRRSLRRSQRRNRPTWQWCAADEER